MDIPNVNWCVFDKINAERDRERQRETETETERDNHATLFNVGSCGLHSIHGDFETAMTSNQ